MTGKVKRWFNKGGYGWITSDEDNVDYFVHCSAIVGEGYKSLFEGVAVEFVLVMGSKHLLICDNVREIPL